MRAHVIINITFDKYYYVELEEKEHEIIIEILIILNVVYEIKKYEFFCEENPIIN